MTQGQQPEALRLADELERKKWHVPACVMQAAAEELRHKHARIAELEAQLDSIGAGAGSGPMMARAADHFPGVTTMAARWYMVDKDGMATLCTDREDAEQEAKDANMAWPHTAPHRAVQLVEVGTSAAELHPSPPEGMVGGWISVEDRLPEPNVEVLCAGQGWGKQFVTACYYDDERSEWYAINTHWTDSTGSAQYPTHWMPLPPPPTTTAGSGKGE